MWLGVVSGVVLRVEVMKCWVGKLWLVMLDEPIWEAEIPYGGLCSFGSSKCGRYFMCRYLIDDPGYFCAVVYGLGSSGLTCG